PSLPSARGGVEEVWMTQSRELGHQEYPGKSSDLSYPYPRFSLAERDRRWAAVRAEMAKAGVDVLVGSNNTGHWDHWQSDIRYLTQIGGHCFDAARGASRGSEMYTTSL